MVGTNDAAVVAVMVAMAQDAMVVPIMISVAISVMMTDIVTIMVMAFAVVVLGESITAQSKRQSEKQYETQPVHTHLKFLARVAQILRFHYWTKCA